LESVVCNLCRQDNVLCVYRVQDTNYGTPGLFSIVKCVQCGLSYLNPRPSPSELSAIYPEDRYHPFSAMNAEGETAPAPLLWKRVQRLTTIAGPGRVLDLGCGSGLFLKAMQEVGWYCVGVELNAMAAEFAHYRLGLDVRQGDISQLELPEKFDLVTLWDVLEHTGSPAAVLARVHDLLVPGGLLAISVPNWESLERKLFRERWIALDAPRHFYHFSPVTITHLLQKSGFELQSIRAQAPVLSLASNTLRLLGDFFLRRGRAKALHSPAVSAPPVRLQPGSRRQIVIRLVHFGLIPVNGLFNRLNRGATLEVIAQKVG
jgi:2-polyprenyl-3-methyl-5-hydroxy-6-metoxy-1,4-benzoquinol methylase